MCCLSSAPFFGGEGMILDEWIIICKALTGCQVQLVRGRRDGHLEILAIGRNRICRLKLDLAHDSLQGDLFRDFVAWADS